MRTKHIIPMVLLTALIFSCGGERLGYCELTEAQKQLIPYAQGQIISFIDSAEQVVDLTVVENSMGWIDYPADIGGEDYYSYRVNTVILESKPNNLKISLYHTSRGCSPSGDYSEFVIYIFPLLWTGGSSTATFSLRSDSERNFPTSTDVFSHNSIEINNKVYYDVVEQSKVLYGVSLQLFYNKTYGILQINRDGESFLTLKP